MPQVFVLDAESGESWDVLEPMFVDGFAAVKCHLAERVDVEAAEIDDIEGHATP